MIQTIAIHHVRLEHRAAFLAFMAKVETAVADASGLIDFTSWVDALSGWLVGVGRWESQQAFEAAMPQIMSLSSERQDHWTERPDELLVLVDRSAEATGPRRVPTP